MNKPVVVYDLTAQTLGPGDARMLLRYFVDAPRPAGGRTWAVFGELGQTPDVSGVNAWVLDHDRVGRQAVRLAVDKTVALGSGRAVRALYQGAVMEGSWGEEALHLESAEAAIELFREELTGGDAVLVLGGGTLDLSRIVSALLDDSDLTVQRAEMGMGTNR